MQPMITYLHLLISIHCLIAKLTLHCGAVSLCILTIFTYRSKAYIYVIFGLQVKRVVQIFNSLSLLEQKHSIKSKYFQRNLKRIYHTLVKQLLNMGLNLGQDPGGLEPTERLKIRKKCFSFFSFKINVGKRGIQQSPSKIR